MKLFEQCRFAYETGILPKDAPFEEQPFLFGEVYPNFVHEYKERNYGRVWQDVNTFAGEVFKVIGKMFGGKG